MTALDPKADIRLIFVVMTANDPKRTYAFYTLKNMVGYWLSLKLSKLAEHWNPHGASRLPFHDR